MGEGDKAESPNIDPNDASAFVKMSHNVGLGYGV